MHESIKIFGLDVKIKNSGQKIVEQAVATFGKKDRYVIWVNLQHRKEHNLYYSYSLYKKDDKSNLKRICGGRYIRSIKECFTHCLLWLAFD